MKAQSTLNHLPIISILKYTRGHQDQIKLILGATQISIECIIQPCWKLKRDMEITSLVLKDPTRADR